jgi:hypothetical protein
MPILVTTNGGGTFQPREATFLRMPELKDRGLARRTDMSTDKTPANVSNTEAVTLSFPRGLPKRARLLAAARETSLSRLVAELLDAAIKEELPALLLNFKSEE